MSSVLIVEDDRSLRELFNAVLTGRGHRVSEAGTLAAGLKLARATHPDLVLLDLGLPDERGLRTLFRWRTEFPEATVVVVTGEIMLGKEATLMGAMDYVEKPVDAKALANRVDHALDRAQVWVYRPIKEKLDKLIAELEAKSSVPGTAIEEEKLPPADPRPGNLYLPLIPAVVACVFVLAVALAWLSFSARTAHPAVAAEQEAIKDKPDPVDAKLAELKNRPTLATVSWFDRQPPVPERRGEVLNALRPLLESDSRSVRMVARNAIERWKR